MSKGKSMGEDKIENQTKCLINSEGHVWMVDFFDTLPLAVRQRLRSSSFNICLACLVVEVLPTVRRQHPNWSREKLLFAAIAVMEAEVRKGKKA
jgi:hypothetical protein